MKKHPILFGILLCVFLVFFFCFLYVFEILPSEIAVPATGITILLSPFIVVFIFIKNKIKRTDKSFNEKKDEMINNKEMLSSDEYDLYKVQRNANVLIKLSAVLEGMLLLLTICCTAAGDYGFTVFFIAFMMLFSLIYFMGLEMKKHPLKFVKKYIPQNNVYDVSFKDKTEWYYDEACSKYLKNNNKEIDELTEEDEDAIWEYARTHLAFIVGWLIENDFLILEEDNEDLRNYMNDVKLRKVTPSEFVQSALDERLNSDDISPEILDFIKDYYECEFFDDYENFITEDLKKELFTVKFSWDYYDKFKEYINDEYKLYMENNK